LLVIPPFAADETNERFIPLLQKDCEEEDRRLLYVAITRAREKVILEWPSHLKNKEGVTYWSLLSSDGRISLEEDHLKVGIEQFKCSVFKAEKTEAADVAAGREKPLAEPLSVFGRRAIRPGEMPRELTPETVTPSLLHAGAAIAVTGETERERFTETPGIFIAGEATGRGTILHRCFELLDGDGDAGGRLEAALGSMLDAPLREAVVSAADGFYAWLKRRFAPIAIGREIPVIGVDNRGSVVSGVIDLLVETAKGFWIVDHKSDQPDDLEARFREYLPQLLCYAEVLGSLPSGKKVVGVAVHWIMRGEATLQKL
jgi:ATP-dependent helicase/nuclease subunit A